MHSESNNCPHCEEIRDAAEVLISLTFRSWKSCDIAQCLAYIHARIRRFGVDKYGIGSKHEEEYLKWFNNLCELEFQYINENNPLEPKFDEEFDFRKEIK